MKPVLSTLLSALLLTALACLPAFAAGNAPAQAARLNLAAPVVISGTVTDVRIDYGLQYPAILVNGSWIKLAPVWYLVDKGIEISVGDVVKVTAVPCTEPDGISYYAIDITLDGTTYPLRTVDGTPAWNVAATVRFDRARYGTSSGGSVVAGSVTTVTGVIDGLVMNRGIRNPEMTILLGNGTRVVVKLGPERYMEQNDFELKLQERVTARIAVEEKTRAYVALQVTNQVGQTLTFRHDDGSPAW
ncbi:MAG: hypothetical protein JST11_13405 [Acidobacteria bacterium]|nr:hypothetical protein [Acidobacteriota bacterium]